MRVAMPLCFLHGVQDGEIAEIGCRALAKWAARVLSSLAQDAATIHREKKADATSHVRAGTPLRWQMEKSSGTRRLRRMSEHEAAQRRTVADLGGPELIAGILRSHPVRLVSIPVVRNVIFCGPGQLITAPLRSDGGRSADVGPLGASINAVRQCCRARHHRKRGRR